MHDPVDHVGNGASAACRSAATEPNADQKGRRLLAAISAGNRSALARLHCMYFQPLAKFFADLTATSAADVVEDLVTQTMFRVWRESRALATQTSVCVSILRIAYACASERLAVDDDPNAGGGIPPPCSPNRDDAVEPESPPQSLRELLRTLPLVQRALVHLVYSGHSRQKVADILSLSGELVDAHLARSRSTLNRSR